MTRKSSGEFYAQVQAEASNPEWVEQPSVVPTAEPQPVGLMGVLRFAGLTAELRFEAPYMVGVPTIAGIVPTLGWKRASRLGRLLVRLRASTYYYSPPYCPPAPYYQPCSSIS